MHMLPSMLASFIFLCIIFILYMVLSTGRTTAPTRSLASPTYYADWQIPYAMHHTTTFPFISLHTQASDLLRFTSFICTFCALPTHPASPSVSFAVTAPSRWLAHDVYMAPAMYPHSYDPSRAHVPTLFLLLACSLPRLCNVVLVVQSRLSLLCISCRAVRELYF